jgi:lipid A 3-O-deacylase|tara:strand:+ start:230 stop:748 length:519 start_codon:yes stop_codon:yes gene_type:complete
MKLKKCNLLLLLFLFFTPVDSKEEKILISDKEYSFYTGTFDTIDKEGDDKATIYGFEHNNPILFRETLVGKFSPISGVFMTNKNSIYLYTGVQAKYEIGSLNIIPSFAPGYYDNGKGKDLGMALEFKSEIKLSFDIFKDSTIGYSYSHISNNDWGERNPGVNNQTISFSKTF